MRGKAQKNIYVICILIIALMTCLSILSFINYSKNLKKALEERTKQELEQYTKQSVSLINSIIESYFDKMDVVGTFTQVNGGINDSEIIKMLKKNNESNKYQNIGVSGTDGILYTGIKPPINISGKDYFSKVLQGEVIISDVLEETKEGKNKIVLADPIREDEKVVGCVCAIYDVNMFTDLFAESLFKNIGATMIMQKDGVMVSSYEGMQDYNTFYDMLQTMKLKKGEIEKFKEKIEKEESGFLVYYNNQKARYLYFEPTGIRDWVALSLVAANQIDKPFIYINMQALQLMGINMGIYSIILISVSIIYKKGNTILKRNQTDILTQLYNKAGAKEAAENFLKKEGKDKKHALFFIDLDNFKTVNDTMGHAEGDRLLSEFSMYLKNCFREDDIVSRFGGDEFFVVMKNISGQKSASIKADEINKIFENNFRYSVSCSIGIACYPQDGIDYETLQRCADTALYRAKNKGKNQYCFFRE